MLRPWSWPLDSHRSILAIGLGAVAAQHGHRVLFATATGWVTRLTDGHRRASSRRAHPAAPYGLIIVDEVGYLPFEQDAANLFFQLVSVPLRHASLILTSNLPFSAAGEVSSATKPSPQR